MQTKIPPFDELLRQAIDGMTYPSEGEFQPLQILQTSGGLPKGKPVKYDEFIRPRLTGPHQQERYIALDNLMRSNLTNLEVLIAVTVNVVTIYVTGKLNEEPGLIGWKTTAVQT